ncbi:hypothetical protein E3O53_13610 [Cryobacterium sp. TMT2-18-3]|nr:hypothetical protein E3O22_06095 [Cryobacterium sp. TMT2-18-2]TFC37528.1 hypothetical protein E3O18_05500 [Cryobacterium sp. TMT2-42-4]TFC61615.1 hypothetical protein E3O53_13610 [Cryobacterium sp. TMT2-18-3]
MPRHHPSSALARNVYSCHDAGNVTRNVLSDETGALLGPLFPPAKQRGRPPVDRRLVVEAVIWRF